MHNAEFHKVLVLELRSVIRFNKCTIILSKLSFRLVPLKDTFSYFVFHYLQQIWFYFFLKEGEGIHILMLYWWKKKDKGINIFHYFKKFKKETTFRTEKHYLKSSAWSFVVFIRFQILVDETTFRYDECNHLWNKLAYLLCINS